MCNCVQFGILVCLAALTVDFWIEPMGPCDRNDTLHWLNDACLLERLSLVRNLERRREILNRSDLLYLYAGLKSIEDRCRAIASGNDRSCYDLTDEMEAWLTGAQAFANRFE